MFTCKRFVLMAAKQFFRPCVYGVKRYGRWFYIGSSAYGLARFAAHERVGRPDTWHADDELFLWYHETNDIIAIRRKERQLIQEHLPRLNRDCNPRFKPWSKALTRKRRAEWMAAKHGITFHDNQRVKVARINDREDDHTGVAV